MEEILKNNFETVYKDYKDYESFVSSTKDSINKQREAFKDRAIKEQNEDLLVNDLFDLSLKPIQSDADLRILRDRLISVYDAYRIVIDFPEEIKQEIKSLQRPLQIYTISKGEQVDIDKEKSDRFREEARKTHLELIKNLKIN